MHYKRRNLCISVAKFVLIEYVTLERNVDQDVRGLESEEEEGCVCVLAMPLTTEALLPHYSMPLPTW